MRAGAHAQSFNAKASPHSHMLILKSLPSTPSFEGCSSKCLHEGSHPLKAPHLWFWALQFLLLPYEHTAHPQLKEQSTTPGTAGSGPSTAVFQFPSDGVFWLHGVQHSARAPGRQVRPLEGEQLPGAACPFPALHRSRAPG